MSKDSDHSKHPAKSLQTTQGQVPARPDSQFVDMQDILPVMSSFREYIDEEQKRTQARLRTFSWVFGAAGVALLVLPLYLAHTFTKQSQKATEAQIEAQERIAESILAGLERLSTASQGLRSELAAERTVPAQPVLEPALEAMIVSEENTGKAEEPAPMEGDQADATSELLPAPTVAEPVQEPLAETAPAAPVGEVEAPKAPATAEKPAAVSLNGAAKPEEIVLSSVADRKEVQPSLESGAPVVPSETVANGKNVTDLESLLLQVEKAIADKEKALREGREKR